MKPVKFTVLANAFPAHEVDYGAEPPRIVSSFEPSKEVLSIFHKVRQMKPSENVNDDYYEGFNAALDEVEKLLQNALSEK